MPVSAGGDTADADGHGGRSALPRRLLIGFALVALIGAIGAVAWIELAPTFAFDEPSCSSAIPDPRHGGCVAALPIADIEVRITATVGLSPNGDTLLLGGPLRSDKTKVVLAGFNVAEKRETWRKALDDFGPDVRVAVSAKGDMAAAWGALGIRVMDVPDGRPVVAVPIEVLGARLFYFDVAFSEGGDAILAGDAARRSSFRLTEAASEPVPAPGFDRADSCHPQGQVGQSNIGSVRSRDGKMVVLLPTVMAGAPVRIGQSVRSEQLSAAICGTRSVSVLVGPAGWSDVTALFASFSPNNDRLAVVYAGKTPHGAWRTLIDVWDAANAMERLASFPIRGSVGYRIGWSHDAHRLAAIRSSNDGTDALIFALP